MAQSSEKETRVRAVNGFEKLYRASLFEQLKDDYVGEKTHATVVKWIGDKHPIKESSIAGIVEYCISDLHVEAKNSVAVVLMADIHRAAILKALKACTEPCGHSMSDSKAVTIDAKPTEASAVVQPDKMEIKPDTSNVVKFDTENKQIAEVEGKERHPFDTSNWSQKYDPKVVSPEDVVVEIHRAAVWNEANQLVMKMLFEYLSKAGKGAYGALNSTIVVLKVSSMGRIVKFSFENPDKMIRYRPASSGEQLKSWIKNPGVMLCYIFYGKHEVEFQVGPIFTDEELKDIKTHLTTRDTILETIRKHTNMVKPGQLQKILPTDAGAKQIRMGRWLFYQECMMEDEHRKNLLIKALGKLKIKEITGEKKKPEVDAKEPAGQKDDSKTKPMDVTASEKKQ